MLLKIPKLRILKENWLKYTKLTRVFRAFTSLRKTVFPFVNCKTTFQGLKNWEISTNANFYIKIYLLRSHFLLLRTTTLIDYSTVKFKITCVSYTYKLWALSKLRPTHFEMVSIILYINFITHKLFFAKIYWHPKFLYHQVTYHLFQFLFCSHIKMRLMKEKRN